MLIKRIVGMVHSLYVFDDDDDDDVEVFARLSSTSLALEYSLTISAWRHSAGASVKSVGHAPHRGGMSHNFLNLIYQCNSSFAIELNLPVSECTSRFHRDTCGFRETIYPTARTRAHTDQCR
jgi:hypothetical protein